MGPLVVLEPAEVNADPGGSARVNIRIHNQSNIVDGYRIDVLGDPSPWAEVSPPEVQGVLPDRDAAVTLVLRPPADSGGPVGSLPFGVRVSSVDDRLRAAVAEGTIRVSAQAAATIAVMPAEAAGRRSASCQVEVRNRGNERLDLRLRASDSGSKLKFNFDPPVVHVSAGQTAWSTMRASFPTNLRGPELRYQVEVAFAEHDPSTPAWAPFSPRSRQGVNGSTRVNLVQRPLVPRALAGLVGLALLAGLVMAAYRIAKPAVPSVESVTQGDAGQLIVAFKPVARARRGYEVLRYQADMTTRADSPPVEAAGGKGAEPISATVDDLAPGTHCFRIRAKGVIGISSQSDVAEDDCAEVAAVTLPVPTDLKLTERGEGSYNLSWTGDDAPSYEVLKNNQPLVESVQGDNTVVEAEPGDCFIVRARSADGKATSAKSEEACVVPRILVFGGNSPPPGMTLDALEQEAATIFGWTLEDVERLNLENGVVVLVGPAGPDEVITERCDEVRSAWTDRREGRACGQFSPDGRDVDRR